MHLLPRLPALEEPAHPAARVAAGRVEFLDPQLKVKPGAVIVTLGSAGDAPFVPGVPVGTVRQVVSTPGALTHTVLVTPYVDATSVDTVAVVVQPPRTDPRDAMVPGAVSDAQSASAPQQP